VFLERQLPIYKLSFFLALPGALLVIVVNQFPKSDRIANLLRNNAAISGTLGAKLDERLHVDGEVRVFEKLRPGAFTNPDLEPYLKAHAVTQLFILGVFAEGCVRSTAIYAIGTNGEFKRRLAIRARRRAEVNLAPMVCFTKKAG
jgi:nicotinamidase-related amidase